MTGDHTIPPATTNNFSHLKYIVEFDIKMKLRIGIGIVDLMSAGAMSPPVMSTINNRARMREAKDKKPSIAKNNM